jgi:hypothetical protein
MNTVATTNVERPIGGAGEDELLSVADAIRSRLFATASPFVSFLCLVAILSCPSLPEGVE